MRISDWSSDVCSSDLQQQVVGQQQGLARSRGEWCALFEARRAQRVQQQRAADDDGEEDQDEQPARRAAAKACTLVSTPERTRNVPRSDREKAAIASRTVQTRKLTRFSVPACEGDPTSTSLNS